jgi:drug/metabolite transporter (DMT)-like permease
MGRWLATVCLLGVTAIWGWTFVVVHDAVAVYGVMPFLAVRFALAAVVTTVIWGRHLDRRSLLVGGGIGLVLALGYLFQTWGLKFTTPTNSGLITGLFVIFAPVVDRLIFGTRMPALRWLAVGLSLIGMTLLTGRVPTDLALGDLLTLICAVWLGIHIALLSRHAPRHDPRALGTAQMLGIGLLFLVLWPASGPVQAPPREVWLAIVITGLFASALAYVIQTAVQQHLTTARTAIILTTEPVFAGVFGYLLAGDRLGPLQAAGALLILVALGVSEIVPHLTKRATTARG